MLLRNFFVALVGLTTIVGGARAEGTASIFEEQTFPGSLCQIISGPAKHFDGGVKISAGTIATSTIQCPITRKFIGTLGGQPASVSIVDNSPAGDATCSLNLLKVGPGGAVELQKTSTQSTFGSNPAVQVLNFGSQVSIGARDAFYLECNMSARFGSVHLVSYSATVAD